MSKKSKKAKSEFPQTIYVKREVDDDYISFLVADDVLTGIVDMGQTVLIGVYDLVGTREMEGQAVEVRF